VFDQYLRTTDIPLLRYSVNGKTLTYNYERVVKGFAMPIRVTINGKELKLIPTEAKQTLDFSEEIKTFEVNRNFYIEAEMRLEPQKAQETQRRQEGKSRHLYSHVG
jgi:hypothetical protein